MRGLLVGWCLNTFPVPKGLRPNPSTSCVPIFCLNTFPVPKGLRRTVMIPTPVTLVFEYFPCSEGIKTAHPVQLAHLCRV